MNPVRLGLVTDNGKKRVGSVVADADDQNLGRAARITAAKHRNETVIDADEYYDAMRVINRICEVGHAA